MSKTGVNIKDKKDKKEEIERHLYLLKYGDLDMKKHAVECLIKIGDEETKNNLFDLHENVKDSLTRGLAFWAISELSGKNGIEELFKIVKSEEQGELIKIGAVRSIGILNKKDTITILKEIALKNDSKSIRICAAYCLSRFADDDISEYFIEKLNSRNPFYRIHAAEALGEIKNAECIKQLTDLLRED